MRSLLRVKVAYLENDQGLDEARYNQDGIVDTCVVDTDYVAHEYGQLKGDDQDQDHGLDLQEQFGAGRAPAVHLDVDHEQ